MRRWVPELAEVPDDGLAESWAINDMEQKMAGRVIGRDYPEPIVAHAEDRKVAEERYREAG